MSAKGPIATEVREDGFGGYMCAKGLCAIYADKIERGPKIGVRITWRHVERNPVCVYREREGLAPLNVRA